MSQSNGRPTLLEIAEQATEGSALKELAVALIGLRGKVDVLTESMALSAKILGGIDAKLDKAIEGRSQEPRRW
ncbi:hypothetical protein [Streptomyces sp. NPDC058466]|uniref:hypothetical protein n=1 Tax=Streptomyces sp. NPDC058466 TaxID=3346512 RepID=UPI00365F7751